MALEWRDVDLGGGVIHVRRSWDPRAGIAIAVKSAVQKNWSLQEERSLILA